MPPGERPTTFRLSDRIARCRRVAAVAMGRRPGPGLTGVFRRTVEKYAGDRGGAKKYAWYTHGTGLARYPCPMSVASVLFRPAPVTSALLKTSPKHTGKAWPRAPRQRDNHGTEEPCVRVVSRARALGEVSSYTSAPRERTPSGGQIERATAAAERSKGTGGRVGAGGEPSWGA